MSADPPMSAVDSLQAAVVSFVRGFGLLQSDTTPCGRPLSVSQAHALSEIAAQPGLTQRDLTDTLGLARASISELLSELVDRGWIVRSADVSDRRQRTVVLTDEGVGVVSDLESARSELFAEILADLPADQHAVVVQGMTLLAESLERRQHIKPSHQMN